MIAGSKRKLEQSEDILHEIQTIEEKRKRCISAINRIDSQDDCAPCKIWLLHSGQLNNWCEQMQALLKKLLEGLWTERILGICTTNLYSLITLFESIIYDVEIIHSHRVYLLPCQIEPGKRSHKAKWRKFPKSSLRIPSIICYLLQKAVEAMQKIFGHARISFKRILERKSSRYHLLYHIGKLASIDCGEDQELCG